MNSFKSIRRSIAISSLMFVPALDRISIADTVVSPTNMNGWSFLTTDSNGDPAVYPGTVAQMVIGPVDAGPPLAGPPAGIGSAELGTAPGHGDGSTQITTGNYNETPLADLTELSYYTYDTVNNGQQYPYLKLNISTTGPDGPVDDALFFEPPYQTPAAGNPSLPDQGATAYNTWQKWDALDGGWWDNNGVGNPGTAEGPNPGVISLATYLDTYPDAVIEGSSANNAISLRVGYADAGNDFDGNVDAFTIGSTDLGTTTYDFEPASVPEPASAGLLCLGGSALLMKRRHSARVIEAATT